MLSEVLLIIRIVCMSRKVCYRCSDNVMQLPLSLSHLPLDDLLDLRQAGVHVHPEVGRLPRPLVVLPHQDVLQAVHLALSLEKRGEESDFFV